MLLTSPIDREFRLLPAQKSALRKLRIETAADLLHHYPVRYGNTSEIRNIGTLAKGDDAVIFGRISGLKMSKAFIKKTPMSEAWLEDETGRIKIIWFHQPYLAKMISEGATVRVEGKVTARKSKTEEKSEGQNETLYLSNPKIETVNKVPIGVGKSLFGSESDDHALYPVYPESKGITSNWMYHAIERVFKSGILDTIVDPIPAEILQKYNLPGIKTALIWVHTPKNENDASAARKRFAFEEVFMIQVAKQRDRALMQKEPSYEVTADKKSVDIFMKRFPFAATEAQKRSIDTIVEDFKKPYPMSRLLEGDVGSGKTAVAAVATYAIIASRPDSRKDFGTLQVAYMAPTEILAQQQFENFVSLFRGSHIGIGLITGSTCKKFPSKVDPSGSTKISKAQLTKWVANGEIAVVVGTHALIQKSVTFKHLALVIIDEQHRFGTAQRQKLTKKAGQDTSQEKSAGKQTAKSAEKSTAKQTVQPVPHLLSMTATPIPRTLSLTLFGDLDLSVLDQMPHGRKPVITKIVLPTDRDATYREVEKQLKLGRQAYVICPRVYEPDPDKEMAIIAKSATEEAKRLQRDVFQKWNIGVLHGKMTPIEKEKAMREFVEHRTDILVATSVVEVGVNVPNATSIIIEGAERFGLSQLHQLRGRVVRSNDQAYCYVFAETKNDKSIRRLKALSTAANGFELAEHDLSERGSGELYGGKQWGVSDLAMEALRNMKMVEAAREEAKRIVETDPTLKNHPILAERVAQSGEIHFE